MKQKKEEEKKKRGGAFGADTQIPKIQRFTISFPTAIPFSASRHSLPPSRPMPAISPRSASSDRSENCRGSGPRNGEGGNLCRRTKEFDFSFSLFFLGGRSDIAPPSAPPVFPASSCRWCWGGAAQADLSWPPSCSCCMPTCSSETSAEWKRFGSAVRCRSAQRDRGRKRERWRERQTSN